MVGKVDGRLPASLLRRSSQKEGTTPLAVLMRDQFPRKTSVVVSGGKQEGRRKAPFAVISPLLSLRVSRTEIHSHKVCSRYFTMTSEISLIDREECSAPGADDILARLPGREARGAD